MAASCVNASANSCEITVAIWDTIGISSARIGARTPASWPASWATTGTSGMIGDSSPMNAGTSGTTAVKICVRAGSSDDVSRPPSCVKRDTSGGPAAATTVSSAVMNGCIDPTRLRKTGPNCWMSGMTVLARLSTIMFKIGITAATIGAPTCASVDSTAPTRPMMSLRFGPIADNMFPTAAAAGARFAMNCPSPWPRFATRSARPSITGDAAWMAVTKPGMKPCTAPVMPSTSGPTYCATAANTCWSCGRMVLKLLLSSAAARLNAGAATCADCASLV